MLDGVTHALHGGRSLLEAQHRQHAAHLRHLARHRGQHRDVGGVAKEQIQLLLCLAQGDAQLAHHRSHGLLVAGLTVELLHPDFQRLGLRAMQRRIQALDQHAGLGGLYLVVMPGGHEAGLQIQHCGRHLHGQLGRWWLADALHRLGDTNQRARQTVTGRLQLDQRLGHQPELLGHGPDLAAVAAGDRRPGFGGGGNALARLHQHRGIETPIARHVVVHHRHVLHGIGLVHGLQALAGLLAGLGLRAEEHQILQQAGGRKAVALGHAGVLHEHARSHALDVDVGSDESACQAVKKGRGNLPETARRHIFGLSGRKAPAKLAHLRSCLPVVALDHAQHHAVQHGTCMRTIGQRLGHGPGPARLARTALRRPQVCRVRLVVASQHLGLAVLGEQGYGRDLLTGQHGLQEFHQRKVRALQRGRRFLRAVFGALYEAIDRSFHAAHHLRRSGDAHHLQGAAGLVQLLASNAQCRCIQLLKIRQTGCIRIAHETVHRLGRGLQRLAHFVEHPGQRAQIQLCSCRHGCTYWRVVNH